MLVFRLFPLFGLLSCAPSADGPADRAAALPFAEDADGAWIASIDSVRIDGHFDEMGARFGDAAGGQVALRTETWGRESSPRPMAGVPALDGDVLTWVDDGVTEWWTTRSSGFEQGWTIDRPPAGDGPIVVTVRVAGARVEPWISGDGADLVAADGSAWTYAGVVAWDALGAELPALIEGDGDTLRVVVDDEGARWPITIDPVLTTASETIQGASSARLGWSLAGGDVNNDGYDDLIVGGYSYSTHGAVYVYHGSSSGLGSTPDTSLIGTHGGQYGWDVKTGDFNNDGYADVAIGEDSYNNGTVYVHHGSASGLNTTASTVFAGSTSNEHLGTALAVGDVNGDGYDDLVATNVGRSVYGAADLHLGSSSGVSSTVSVSLSGGSGQKFGYAADGLGDVNGDGYDDIGISHYEAGSYYGRAWIYTGSSSGLSSSRVTTITGSTYDVYFGRAIGGLGDVNGDGYDDVGVGAVGFDTPGYDAGAMMVYYGSSTGVPTTASATVYGTSSDDKFGWAIDTVGDLDDDGYDDVIVGSYNARGAVYGSGTARVIPGSASGLVTADQQTLEGNTSYARFGVEVAGLGDINGDGFEDVAVGQPELSGTSSYSGAAYVYLGYDASAVDSDGDGVTSTTDCDDTDATVYPGATETCDGEDDDCDGTVDDGVSTTYYRDADSDGYGSATSTLAACSLPSGYVTTATDCDDSSALAHPGGTEITGDGIDEDCSGGETCYADVDRDGYGTTSTVASADADCGDAGEATTTTDCADSLATAYPGATETRGDGVDQDCDGGDTCYTDADGDGYGAATALASADLDCADAGEASVGGDCDDASATASPAGTEVATDGIDQNCSGGDLCYADVDRDGYGTTSTVASADADCTDAGEATVTTDCDDGTALVHPAATEARADGVDQDCDGGDACYLDDDGDGYGSATVVASADLDCGDAGEASASTDCDDTSSAIHPTAAEVEADGVDQDCDGGERCYADADLDGYGTTATVASADVDCTDAGESLTTSDCDDTSARAYPGASESVADGVDQSCDGADACFEDLDGDDHGTTTVVTGGGLGCDGAGEATVSDDCDDAVASVYPEAYEVPGDAVDQDCDGRDTCYADGDGDGQGGGDRVVGEGLACDGPGESTSSEDCDDDDETVFAGAEELPVDGVDADCDGRELCWADTDADGYGGQETTTSASLVCNAAGVSDVDTDCDDADADVHPGGEEAPADLVDGDCNGSERCYLDRDGDGHGTTETAIVASLDCLASGVAPDDADCNDASPAIYPGAPENVADHVDQDCDGGDACQVDDDGDGFGAEETVASVDLDCDDAGEAADASDCDDGSEARHPGAEEVCDGADDDCDGREDDGLDDCVRRESPPWFGCSSAGAPSGALASLAGLALLLVRRRRAAE